MTTTTIGCRVTTRIGGRVFTVETVHEANGLDCHIWEGPEAWARGCFLGRMRLAGGEEMSVFTVTRAGTVADLRMVLAHLGLLSIESDGSDDLAILTVNMAVRPAGVPTSAVIVSKTAEKGYAIPRRSDDTASVRRQRATEAKRYAAARRCIERDGYLSW